MANAHWLGSVRQIRLEPRENRTSDAETGTKMVDEGDMINGVKGFTKIQRYKQGRGTKIMTHGKWCRVLKVKKFRYSDMDGKQAGGGWNLNGTCGWKRARKRRSNILDIKSRLEIGL